MPELSAAGLRQAGGDETLLAQGVSYCYSPHVFAGSTWRSSSCARKCAKSFVRSEAPKGRSMKAQGKTESRKKRLSATPWVSGQTPGQALKGRSRYRLCMRSLSTLRFYFALTGLDNLADHATQGDAESFQDSACPGLSYCAPSGRRSGGNRHEKDVGNDEGMSPWKTIAPTAEPP